MSVPLIWTAVIVSLHTSFISLYSHRKRLLELLQDHKEYSNMNCFLFLMCYIAIVSGMSGISGNDGDPTDDNDNTASQSTSQPAPSSTITHDTEASSTSGNRLSSSQSPAVVPQSQSTSGPLVPVTIQLEAFFFKWDCRQVLMASGGLIILCVILLLSVFFLAWKVCRLSRRIKELSSNADLISTSEYWMESAKKNKSKSETEPKETTVLMSDMSQTKEERANGTTEEEGEKENKTEEGDATKSEEAAATPVAVCASSEPKEEAIEATAAPSPEGTEEPKDVV
ncbi:uncharacterized protein [Labrus bergylta]|uniref:uncharacterized protein n=1 Tax=Labrus bergylta TaxID=56723 RepID=UPI00331347EA